MKRKVIAVTGGIGSGKSTVINLIPRFYDVTNGEILFDDVDLRDYNPTDLRSKIALASQKVELFSGTIMENLKYGNPNATEEEIKKACKLACADTFIEEKED